MGDLKHRSPLIKFNNLSFRNCVFSQLVVAHGCLSQVTLTFKQLVSLGVSFAYSSHWFTSLVLVLLVLVMGLTSLVADFLSHIPPIKGVNVTFLKIYFLLPRAS